MMSGCNAWKLASKLVSVTEVCLSLCTRATFSLYPGYSSLCTWATVSLYPIYFVPLSPQLPIRIPE